MMGNRHTGNEAMRHGGWRASAADRSLPYCLIASLPLVTAIALLAGCEASPPSDSSSGGDMTSRQDAAMKDPFSYGPAEHSGKKPVEEPKKRDDSLKGHWDRFWNP